MGNIHHQHHPCGVHPRESSQLKELETSDLITRTEYPEVPPKEYYLSEKGQSIMPILRAFREWGISIFLTIGKCSDGVICVIYSRNFRYSQPH